jgi:hypothetical protein
MPYEYRKMSPQEHENIVSYHPPVDSGRGWDDDIRND